MVEKLPEIDRWTPYDYETEFQKPLAVGQDGEDEVVRFERIRLKQGNDEGREVIRMSFWREGKMINRPAYIDGGIDWQVLFESAVNNGVFDFDELTGMLGIIASKVDRAVQDFNKRREEEVWKKYDVNQDQ